KQYSSKSTLIIIAQRVGTVMNADQIIVLDEGRISGKGTHRELMQQCQAYREIALSQLSMEELA
ncbi:MAG: ABC transporter ATP-binding protein, partial [Actinobacteria bacterium]|nr:ABC transporter ATP-binding protein [Actinomycetota bacterium]